MSIVTSNYELINHSTECLITFECLIHSWRLDIKDFVALIQVPLCQYDHKSHAGNGGLRYVFIIALGNHGHNIYRYSGNTTTWLSNNAAKGASLCIFLPKYYISIPLTISFKKAIWNNVRIKNQRGWSRDDPDGDVYAETGIFSLFYTVYCFY